ncbi:MAG: oligoribonuclease [Patescibacteria group bacterium]|nr:oligoribonuclease [Patescibacteria group bacterium]
MSKPEIQLTNPQTADFLWFDLEFSGLSLQNDVIIEVGAIATQGLFDEQFEYHSFVQHEPNNLRRLMLNNPWWRAQSTSYREDMIERSHQEGIDLVAIDANLATLVREHCATPVHLAGNSIHNDRKWVERYMPQTEGVLHYRMLDVSSLKLVANQLGIAEYRKSNEHRSLADIQESISEFRYLLAGGGLMLTDTIPKH